MIVADTKDLHVGRWGGAHRSNFGWEEIRLEGGLAGLVGLPK